MSEQLNQEQLNAVQTTQEHLLIIAGPGTGKTKTIVHKIDHLLAQHQINPDEVLALTFTNKAAAEMQARLKQTQLTKLPFIGTFHALAHHLLTKFKPEQALELIDQSAQLEIVHQIKQQLKIKTLTKVRVQEVLRLISLKKQLSELDFPSWVEPVMAAYNQTLIDQSVLDFDDLLLQAVDLLTKSKAELNLSYILVDEFQDTNQLQYQLLQLLTQPKTKLTVVGDPQQSIYSFRGANSHIFNTFQQEFAPEKIVLKHNYRNPQEIIDFSQSLFSDTPRLKSTVDHTGRITLIKTLNEYSEAEWVIASLEAKLGGTDMLSSAKREQQESHDKQARFADFAMMFRTHHLSRVLEQKLHDSGIPFQKIGAESPLAQGEIQQLITALKQAKLKPGQKLSQLVIELIEELQLLKILADKPHKLNDLWEFQSLLVQFDQRENALTQTLGYLDYLEHHDYYDVTADKVVLLTMHAAKGLEFKYVYLCAFEDGAIPLVKSKAEVDLAEERRLFYVALTRAKSEIFLCQALERHRQQRQPSRFLNQLEQKHLLQKTDPKLEQQLRRRRQAREHRRQPSLF